MHMCMQVMPRLFADHCGLLTAADESKTNWQAATTAVVKGDSRVRDEGRRSYEGWASMAAWTGRW